MTMTKVHQSNIETASGGGGSAPYPDVEMRSTDHTSHDRGGCVFVLHRSDKRTGRGRRSQEEISHHQDTEDISSERDRESERRSSPPSKTLAETESRSSPPSPEGHKSSVGAGGPSDSANTDARITLAPRGSVLRYFGADDGSYLPLHSTNVYMFDSSVHRNPYTAADIPVASKPNSDDGPLLVSGFLDSITGNSDVPVTSKPDPPLLVSSFTSNSSSTVDSRCSSPDIFSATYDYEEVPVTPPPYTEFPLHPPTLKAHRGPVFDYFGDILNAPVLSLSEDSFHTPIPRS